MEVSIIGLGWYGLPLARSLQNKGYSVAGFTRAPEKAPDIITRPIQRLLQCDILVLNIPPFEGQLEWFQSWTFSPRTWVIFISSTGERSLLRQEEDWARASFKDWTILRFAGLIGPDRHPGNSMRGKTNLPGGKWPVNLLWKDDAVGFTEAVIQKEIKHETINVCCDEHRPREEFYGSFEVTFDPNDLSSKPIVDNSRAKEIYDFKWNGRYPGSHSH